MGEERWDDAVCSKGLQPVLNWGHCGYMACTM